MLSYSSNYYGLTSITTFLSDGLSSQCELSTAEDMIVCVYFYLVSILTSGRARWAFPDPTSNIGPGR